VKGTECRAHYALHVVFIAGGVNPGHALVGTKPALLPAREPASVLSDEVLRGLCVCLSIEVPQGLRVADRAAGSHAFPKPLALQLADLVNQPGCPHALDAQVDSL